MTAPWKRRWNPDESKAFEQCMRIGGRQIVLAEGDAVRFWARVEVAGPDECWPWRLHTNKKGYGTIGFWRDGKVVTARVHRVAFVLSYGTIVDGFDVDHVCRNRACCNPAHLRELEPSVNRSINAWSDRTHCVNGHEFTAENLYPSYSRPSARICRTCALATSSASRRRRAS